jgi:ABC-type molybdate transport system substrate-binding protein
MSYRCVILIMAALLCCGLVGPAGAAEPASRPVTVFAAASLTNVLDELGTEFTRTTGVPVRFSFASSSILARQIEAGAGADVFFPADSHLPITYPVALTVRAGPDAERFVQFVVGDAGRAAFERSGFTTVP